MVRHIINQFESKKDIAVNFFFTELTDKETESYITYRLKKAGEKPDIFSSEAIELIYKTSQGIPRTINMLCDTALVYGFGHEFITIEPPVIEQVIKDKGGMGIHTENKNKAGSFSLCVPHETSRAYEDRLQKLDRYYSVDET